MSKEREMTCIICPNGCNLKVEYADECVIKVDGALCNKGVEYAGSEITNPMRNLTTTIRVEGGVLPLVGVRSDRPISKDKMVEAVKFLRVVTVKAPVCFKQVIVQNILGTGANIIATREIESI